ncbi:MAG TPA: lysophospholipase [Candidatus Acidoferrales bacterium]|nr:lysophospholipase [Candidatus Acidoferrales bacterium]
MVAELTVEEAGLTSADGTRLAYRKWSVSDARLTLAVFHGHGEHSGRYAALAAAMADHRISTYAVDLRGHGRSDGQRGHLDSWSQWLDDAAAFGELVARESPGEVVPLGHSFGGAVVLSAVLRGTLKPRRFAVSSPALRTTVQPAAWKLRLGQVASRLAPRLTLSNEVDARVLSRDPAVVSAYVDDPLVHPKISVRMYTEWVAAADQIRRRAGELELPFLMILGQEDRLIDPTGGREVFERAASKAKVLREYAGRFHEPFNDYGKEEVFADLADWLKRS